MPAAIRAGLGFFYDGHAQDLATAVGLVWLDWCEGWGEPAIAGDLAQYAVGRAKILNLFAAGHVQRPGGGRYTVPEMTGEYRSRMHAAGLTKLGRQLDEFGRTHELLAVDEPDQPGSVLGDAFATSLAAAERAALDLPAREIVLARQVGFHVDVGSGVRLVGEADLLLPEADAPEAVVLEVHDFEAVPWMRAGIAGRDLRVIAASLARPMKAAESTPSNLNWERVARVVFRHWPSGQTFTFRETSSGHLLALTASIARGMRHHVVVPRAVTGYEHCRACAYREHCWNGANWDTLPLVDTGMLGSAEALRAVMEQLRDGLSHDNAAVRRTRQVLSVLENALAETEPADLLAASRRVLEELGDHDH
ncbi:MAG: hypothetical protein IT317_24580 [Anaerolineales bacterium]|nr:hypothetical protein [Anaerolineales bacterium]